MKMKTKRKTKWLNEKLSTLICRFYSQPVHFLSAVASDNVGVANDDIFHGSFISGGVRVCIKSMQKTGSKQNQKEKWPNLFI